METEKVFKAAKSNDLERVKFFIEKKGVPANIVNKKQKTIAHVAVRNDNVDMLDYILVKDPSLLEKKDNHNSTVLQLAVQRDALNVVEYLVENHVHDDNIIGNIIYEAIKRGHQDILRYFFEKRKLDVNQPVTNHVDPPLWLAVRHRKINIVKYLIQVANAKITALDSQGDNILFLATKLGRLNILKDLLEQSKKSSDIEWKRLDGKTLVHIAVMEKQMEILEYLVEEEKVDVNVADNNGNTPLHDAVLLDTIWAYDYFSYLVAHKADWNKANIQGDSPSDLWERNQQLPIQFEAVHSNDFNLLKSLLNRKESKIDVNESHDIMGTLTNYALTRKDLNILRYLVKEKNGIICPEKLDIELRNAVNEASTSGNTTTCELLIELGANVKQVDERGNTFLHEAPFGWSSDTAAWYEFLIEHGCDVNQKNEKGETPLHNAVIHSSLALCEYLVKRGSDVNQKTHAGETPLHLAVHRDQLKICESLIRLGANIDLTDRMGMTPLHIAASRGSPEICKSLIQRGASIDQKNDQGEIPLHLAASRRSRRICKSLIERGASINQKNKRGERPLHLAQANNHQKLFTFFADCNATIDDINGTTVTHIASTKHQTVILEYLITKKNVDVNVQRRADGWTPLHCAAFKQDIEIFRYLMEHGANIEAKDKYGKTPLQVVKDRQSIENVIKNFSDRGSRFIESVAEEMKRSRRDVRESSHTADEIPNYYNQMEVSSDAHQNVDRNLFISLSDTYAPQLQNFLMIFHVIVRNFLPPVHSEAMVSTVRATLQDRMDPMVETAIKSLPNFRE